MNRLVREHYPVSKLPEDLREGLEGCEDVTVTVEVKVTAPAPGEGDRGFVSEPGPFSRYRYLAKPRFTSIEEVDAHVRALRDDWDRPGR